jgi:hypothetical protein
MTAVVSRERAKAAWLTGTAGSLILGGAVVMMAVAAPSQAHARPHTAAAQSYTQSATLAASIVATDLSHQPGWLPPGTISSGIRRR